MKMKYRIATTHPHPARFWQELFWDQPTAAGGWSENSDGFAFALKRRAISVAKKLTAERNREIIIYRNFGGWDEEIVWRSGNA